MTAAQEPCDLMNLTTLALLLLSPLLVWRVYSRVKAMMGRTRSILSRHWTGVLVFSAMVAVTASEVFTRVDLLAWLLVGTAGGIGYGVWGFRKTRREVTPEGYFFTPPARLGIAVAMLFFARILYIGIDMYAGTGKAPHFTDSPINMFAVGFTGAYFGLISAGLARWRMTLKKAQA
jgi:hypothetical protein